MKYRRIGSTGIVVSELGFGASPIGGVFGPVDEADAVNAVHAALDLGVTYFDTSPYYGSTQSEEVLGRALSGIERDRYVLSTTAPVSTFLSFVRTKAPPFPGFTCWKYAIAQRPPSISRTIPLRKSAVLAIGPRVLESGVRRGALATRTGYQAPEPKKIALHAEAKNHTRRDGR